jgi:hypothetical protein
VRIISVFIGVLAILVGLVFSFQGAGVLPGSFMTGQRTWLVIGIVVAVAGLALALSGLRRPARP